MEGCVQGLVLPAQRDAVELEAHRVPRSRVPPKGAVETESDFLLAHDVDVALEPTPCVGAMRLDEDDVAWGTCKCQIRIYASLRRTNENTWALFSQAGHR